jgi:DNA-binding transcriptional LysR family regulator
MIYIMGGMSMLPHLHRMATLAAVVEQGSFGGAARALGTTTSAVSQQVKALERELGLSLLSRSTRRLQLTTAGERFHQACAQVVAAARRADQVLDALRDEPEGELRLTAPAGFARVMGEALGPLLARHPGLQLHLIADDAFIDLVAERVDLALRFGRLPDSSWVAQPLGRLHMLLCAAPAYLARRGIPLHPDDLAQHDGICLSPGPAASVLTLRDPQGQEAAWTLGWHKRLSSTSQLWVQQMVESGLGVGLVAAHEARDALAEGRLVPVLPGWVMPPIAMHALTPRRGPHPAKVRLALAALVEHMAGWPASVMAPWV